MSNIFNMFGPSPIRPIEQHMHKAHCCAKALLPFFEEVNHGNWQQSQELHQQIISLENSADILKKEIRQHLPSGLFLPVSRSDLLELLAKQDKLANKSKDIAGLIMGRHMTLPESVIPLFMPFLKRCIDASRKACKAINELDELLETGFRGNEVHIVEKMLDELDIIENDTDEMLAKIRHQIFSLEETLPTLTVIFLYQLVDWVGDIANYAQSIGGRLQILIAR